MITRIIYSAVALFTFISLIPDTMTAAEHAVSTHVSGEAVHVDAHADAAAHAGPHIPSPKGEAIPGWNILGVDITNTVLSTWIFMVLLFILVGLLYSALHTDKMPRMKAFGLDITSRMLAYITGLLEDKGKARKYMWLLGGLGVVIFLGNIFGLILDVITIIIPSLHGYLRPIYSDMSTTLFMSLSVILIAQTMGIIMKGPVKHFSHYLWHFSGNSLFEKVVNVMVGWLHFIGEFIRVGSLSLRLFLNIFVGAIMISIVVYLGGIIPSFGTGIFGFLTLPFWFFELLVAFLQAYIFMTLSSLYIKESFPDPHH